MRLRAPVAGMVAFAAALIAAVAVLALPLEDSGQRPGAAEQARRAAVRFLDAFMEPDGRVVRRDQGGDTVSEGQAYAMLLAAAVGDRRRFELAWRWSRSHLRRPDGLLSWHWAGGRVTDTEPAADADLDAARALVLAARRFGVPAYRRAAVRMARAILRRETVRAGGAPVLVAGPWARSRRLVNPSYLSPRAFGALARATGDGRWRRVATSSRDVLRRLLAGGRLPPDWSTVARDGSVRASGPPSGGEPAYGYDAVRVPLRLTESCDRRDRRLAAGLWRTLGRGRTVAPVMTLDGQPRAGGEHPAALVGAAAAARAAGQAGEARRLLARAEALDRRQRTYYGSALVALGRVQLTTRMLGGCR